MKSLSLWLVLCLAALVSTPAFARYQRLLSTPARIVIVLVLCDEGEIDCPDVLYVGVDRASGEVTQLKGADWVRRCPRQNEPCQHIGFKFSSKSSDYYITDNGTLTIQSTRGEQLASEHGKWVDI
ncbi:hypothetical protein [Dyella silvae]|uniref:hypothetical protein n=1 Tax=Dyella silvae TaxID=2994424 RepID=UPI002264D686|nr:hypothetical protein [Dyella silvae]